MALFIIRTNLVHTEAEWQDIIGEIKAGGHHCYFDRSEYTASLPDDAQEYINAAKLETGYKGTSIVLVSPSSLFKNAGHQDKYNKKCSNIIDITMLPFTKISDVIRSTLSGLKIEDEVTDLATITVDLEAKSLEILDGFYDDQSSVEVGVIAEYKRGRIASGVVAKKEEKHADHPKIEETATRGHKDKKNESAVLAVTPYLSAPVPKPAFYDDKLLVVDRYNDSLLREAAIYRNKLFKSKSNKQQLAFWNQFFTIYHKNENRFSLVECMQQAKSKIGELAYEAAIGKTCCCFKSGTLKLIQKIGARSSDPDKRSLLRDDIEMEAVAAARLTGY